jgi:hypothetical protein
MSDLPNAASLALHEQRDNRVHSASDHKKTEEEEVKTSGAISCSNNNNKTILQYCQAWTILPSAKKFFASGFLDSGSEITMIRRKFSKEMGL